MSVNKRKQSEWLRVQCQGHKVQFSIKYKTAEIQTTERLLYYTHAQIHQKMRSNISENVLIVIFKVKYQNTISNNDRKLNEQSK